MKGITSFVLYVTVFAISVGCLCYKRNSNKINSINILGITILVLLAAFRYNVGTDFQQYSRNFYNYYRMSWVNILFDRDDGWGLAALIKLLYGIGGDRLSFGICAFLTVFPMYIYLRNEYRTLNLGISLFWYLTTAFVQSFNLVSQYISISILFIGFKYIYRNQFKKYLAVVLVAFLFHKSALIAIVIYFLWDHGQECVIKGWKRIVIILATVIGAYFYQTIIQYLVNHASFFRSYAYLITTEESRNRDFYLSLFQLVVVLLCYQNLKKQDNRSEMLVLMLIISTLIGVTGFTHPQFKRIAYYFSVPSTTILIGYMARIPVLYGGKRSNCTLFAVVYTLFRFLLVYYIIGSLGFNISF